MIRCGVMAVRPESEEEDESNGEVEDVINAGMEGERIEAEKE